MESTVFYYDTNAQGDVIAIYDANGNRMVSYTYDAWGNTLSTQTNGIWGSTVSSLNPFGYRSYYYDSDTGLYYLQSRYYDPQVRRFINADSVIAGVDEGLGYNLFAYCGNNPVNRVDEDGHFWVEILDFFKSVATEIGSAMGLLAPAYAGCGGIAVADGPLPIGDAIGLAIAIILTAGVIGYGVYQAFKTIPNSKTQEFENEATVDIKSSNKNIIFPTNPDEFNPVGLVKVHRPGTKNGALISWMDPVTHIEVFRWDENPNFPNGAHYHVNESGHYIPGIDAVPEPYASIYFPR